LSVSSFDCSQPITTHFLLCMCAHGRWRREKQFCPCVPLSELIGHAFPPLCQWNGHRLVVHVRRLLSDQFSTPNRGGGGS
jgi:hypothetical protein